MTAIAAAGTRGEAMIEDDMAQDGEVDPSEVARFAALAGEWWNPRGPYAPLHKLTPTRTAYVRDRLVRRHGRDARALRSLAGLVVLDVGCGGGLLSEPLTRLGAAVTGIEPAAESIAVARAHAEEAGLAIDYRVATASELAAAGQRFDAVIASEVIEHVPEPEEFVATRAALARPGGLVMISTQNRTLRALALAVVGAEYVLRWVPRGTHDWSKFVTPEELEDAAEATGLRAIDFRGMTLDPLKREWRLTRDLAINYWMTAEKPAE
jgi:2-polyprenyl-6-hydroxyphenyl methylase/3-demethylubiquinone-9 3-methyltransferase